MRIFGSWILIFISAVIASISYSYAEDKRYVVPVEDSPVYGPKTAAVTIIEFLDFQ